MTNRPEQENHSDDSYDGNTDARGDAVRAFYMANTGQGDRATRLDPESEALS